MGSRSGDRLRGDALLGPNRPEKHAEMLSPDWVSNVVPRV